MATSLWAIAARPKNRQAPGSAVDDLADRRQGEMQEFRIARDREADPPGLFGEGGGLAEPSAGPGEMRDIRAAFPGRDGESKTAADQSVHTAGRIADRIDGRARVERLQLATVEHGLPKRRRREAEPAFARDDRMRLRQCGHGVSDGSFAVDISLVVACRRDATSHRARNPENLCRLIADGQSGVEIRTRARAGSARTSRTKPAIRRGVAIDQ